MRYEDVALETFGRRPREALMWAPRAADVGRIAAVCREMGPRVVDVGAGTGLLAALLAAEGVEIEALDPAPPEIRYHPVRAAEASTLDAPVDVAIVSWMEAGRDYRDAVARVARCIVNAYDVDGGCGVLGATDFAGYIVAASWRAPSFEDVEFALDRPGRGLQRRGWPGCSVDVLVRSAEEVARVRAALASPPPARRLPWEDELERRSL